MALRVIAYNKARQRQGSVGAVSSVECVLGRNVPDSATFDLPTNSPQIGILSERGTRVRILDDDQPVMSGLITGRDGVSGPIAGSGFTVDGDWQIIRNILAWPVPTALLSDQTVAYRTVTGPLETVFKTVLQENADRLGVTLNIEATQNRGPTVTVRWRFHDVSARILNLLNANGVTVEAIMDEAGVIQVTYREAAIVRKPFSMTAGNLKSWEFHDEAPTVTRVIVGGQGEGAARRFVSVIGTAREDLWGAIIEGFVDARDLDSTATDADLIARGQETLDETVEKTSLALGVISTPAMRYGEHYRIGDEVKVEVGGGVVKTEILSTCTLTWNRAGGMVTAPGVNTLDTGNSKVYRKLSQLTTTTNDLQRR